MAQHASQTQNVDRLAFTFNAAHSCVIGMCSSALASCVNPLRAEYMCLCLADFRSNGRFAHFAFAIAIPCQFPQRPNHASVVVDA